MQSYTATVTADPVTGDFNFDLPDALVAGEKVKITAHHSGQVRTLNLQAPIEPYLPPESGGNTNNNEAIVESPDGKFAITTSFPNNSELSAEAAIAVNDGYGIEKDPLRFNRGAKVRKVGDIYYVKPNVLAGEANANSVRMYFAIRVKRSDVYAATANEKIVTVGDSGYYEDSGIGYENEDEKFDGGSFLVNYDKSQFFMAVNTNRNATADIEYMYIVVPIYFSVSGGTFAHSKHGSAENLYTLKARRKARIFGTEFKIQLDAA